MSNPPQPPADGWQPPQSPQEPPVYRPNEQPPAEEPPPWSPESQRMSPPPSQQVPVEDVDGTVRYTSGPQQSQPQAPFAAPPGVPVSPFDQPMSQSGAPVSGMPAQGMPPQQGMAPPGAPPVSGMPASGVPVSPGQGQFGPQGGQVVPMSGAPTGQPWGGAQPPNQIQRKKKSGNKMPMWILLAGIVVIAGALAVGGFILFNPNGSNDDGGTPATIETPGGGEPELVSDQSAGLKYGVGDDAAWAEAGDAPTAFSSASGRTDEDEAVSAFVGAINHEELGVLSDADLGDAGPAFDLALAAHLDGEIAEEPSVANYWIDARQGQFRTFTVGDTEVYSAIVQVDGGFEGFVAFAPADQEDTAEALRGSLRYGEL